MHTVQIKRKRDADPLQTLVVRAKRKKVDTVFRLAGTVNSQAQNDIILARAGEGLYRLPPKLDTKSAIEDDIPAELKEMINDYISDSSKPQENDPIPSEAVPVAVDSPDAEVEDYVYDVYYSEHANGGTPGSGKIGYIDVESDDERLLVDEDDDSDFVGEEDDDSNAEDFYRNDYPDEEDSVDQSDLELDLAELNIGSDSSANHDLEVEDDWSEDISS